MTDFIDLPSFVFKKISLNPNDETIGSKVKIGDCAYESNSVDELVDIWTNEWHVAPHLITRLPNGIRIEHEMVKAVETTSISIGSITESGETDCDPVEEYEPAESEFQEILVGRGEWTAMTLEDAREMAVAFANSVS